MHKVWRHVIGLFMVGAWPLFLGCSGEVQGSGGQGGAGGSPSCADVPGTGGGGGTIEAPEVRGGFGITGNANFMHDLVKTSMVDVTWSNCILAYSAAGPIEAGNCQVTLGMVLGGAPQVGKKYVLDAKTASPADGQGYATVVESCTDAGTKKAWRSTEGSLVVDSVVGKRLSLIYGDSTVVSLAPDMTVMPNDAMGTMVMSGYANIDFP